MSLTAGTILDSTKLPLPTWFLAMYLLTRTKHGASALELSRQLGVSYNTAWSVKYKVMQVMKERDDTRPLGGWVQLDDAYWGGERRGGKRGRGAPGKTPFVAAVEHNRECRPVRIRLGRVGAFQGEEIAAWAKCHLEPGTLVLCDALGCFRAVQRAGCFHQPFVTGGRPASEQHPALSWVNTILGNSRQSGPVACHRRRSSARQGASGDPGLSMGAGSCRAKMRGVTVGDSSSGYRRLAS